MSIRQIGLPLFVLSFFLLFFFLFVTNVKASPVNYSSTSYNLGNAMVISKGYATYGYGGLTTMTLYSWVSSDFEGRIYIKWDLSMIPVNSTINSSYLYLYSSYVNNANTKYVLVYNTSTNWIESGAGFINWNNAPAGQVLSSNESMTGTANTYKKFNITDAVQSSVNAGTNVSIMLRLDDETTGDFARTFYSRQGTIKPILEIDYSTSSGCPSHVVNGTWCDDYNLTPMCTDYVISGCWDPYTESLPNPFNASKNTFTTFKAINGIDCGIEHNQCPSGYMCIQQVYWNDQIPADRPQPSYPNPIYSTSLLKNYTDRGAIACHSDQSLTDYYFDENGNQVNFSDLFFPNNTLFSCENPELYNNSWACIVSSCHWCSSTSTCQASVSNCPNACINASQFNNPVDCNAGHCNWCNDQCQLASCPTGVSGGVVTSLGTYINNLFGFNGGTAIIAFIASASISMYIFLHSSSKKLETFIIPFFVFMAGFSMPYVDFFPLWIYLVMVTFSGVIIFWKAKG